MSNETVILDFGSSKLTVLVGERGVNNTINVKALGTAEYAGFGGGEWYDEQRLGAAIASAIGSVTSEGYKIDRLYVGVPGEFTSVVTKELSVSLNKRRRIKEDDIDALMSLGDNFDQSTHEVIHIQPVYFSLDNDRRVPQAVGAVSGKLGGLLSYILVESSFVELVGSILSTLDITSVEYVSSVLSSALIALDSDKRDDVAVLIDVGYITSTVAVVRGDGITSLASFSMGGGFITGDLAMAMELSFKDAEALKRKVILSLSAGENDVYEINTSSGVKSFSAKEVNELVTYRIRLIAKAIAKCLAIKGTDYPDYIPYSLTGGGISFIRGVKDVLSRELGRSVEIVAPVLPQVDKPNLTSAWGVLDMAINNERPEKKGLFARLFK